MIPSRRARCSVIYTVWNPDKDSVREPGEKETIVRDGRVYMMYFIAPEWGKCAEAERVIRRALEKGEKFKVHSLYDITDREYEEAMGWKP